MLRHTKGVRQNRSRWRTLNCGGGGSKDRLARCAVKGKGTRDNIVGDIVTRTVLQARILSCVGDKRR